MQISANIYQPVTLDQNSYYLNLNIQKGGELKLLPETKVYIERIYSEGKITAKGQKGKEIVFENGSIQMKNTQATSTFEYAIFKNAGKKPVNKKEDQVFYLDSAKLNIKNSILKNNQGGIQAENKSNVLIESSTLKENKKDLTAKNNSYIQISNSNIQAKNKDNTAVFADSTSMIDAKNNWWGSIFGPFEPSSNKQGKTTKVLGNVLFLPWALEEF